MMLSIKCTKCSAAFLLLVLLVMAALLLLTKSTSKRTDPRVYSQAAIHVARAGPDSVTDPKFQTIQTIDSLAGSAPLLTDVTKQKEAVETLHRMLRKEPLQHACQKVPVFDNGGRETRRYCNDTDFAVQAPCLVYSFGINYNFKLDDYFGEKGCDVFSFDPSMTTPDHRRSPRVMFYRMGLGEEDTDSFVPRLDGYMKRNVTWRMRTLKTFMAMLNHSNAVIDILKIDVECSEWASVRNMLDTGALRQVKQLLVEWHIFKSCPPRERFQQLLTVLDDLKKAGFRSFYRDRVGSFSLDWKRLNIQNDFGYVNTRFVRP